MLAYRTEIRMYSSGQNKVNVRLACNDRATVIPFSFRTRFVIGLQLSVY